MPERRLLICLLAVFDALIFFFFYVDAARLCCSALRPPAAASYAQIFAAMTAAFATMIRYFFDGVAAILLFRAAARC